MLEYDREGDDSGKVSCSRRAWLGLHLAFRLNPSRPSTLVRHQVHFKERNEGADIASAQGMGTVSRDQSGRARQGGARCRGRRPSFVLGAVSATALQRCHHVRAAIA